METHSWCRGHQVFMHLVLDTIIMNGWEPFLPLSASSGIDGRGTTATHYSLSILLVPWAVSPELLKWQPCYSCSFSCPQTALPVPCSRVTSNMPRSGRKPYPQNMCTGAELSAQSIYLVLITQEINSVHQCMLVISTSLIKAFISIKTLVKIFL